MHFYNHNTLALVFNFLLGCSTMMLFHSGGNHFSADLIRYSFVFLTVISFGLHFAHFIWLRSFVKELNKKGYSRGRIASRVAEIEIKYEFSLLKLHLWLRPNDGFEPTAIEAYFRTVRFKNWGLTPSSELNSQ